MTKISLKLSDGCFGIIQIYVFENQRLRSTACRRFKFRKINTINFNHQWHRHSELGIVVLTISRIRNGGRPPYLSFSNFDSVGLLRKKPYRLSPELVSISRKAAYYYVEK